MNLKGALTFFFIIFCAGCSTTYQDLSDSHIVSKPFLFPLVMIDPGHGGKDPGAKAELPLVCVEKNLTLYLAKKTALYLKNKGVPTVLTRESDMYVSLEDRVKLAESKQAKLFVSIHGNAAKNKEAEGIEVFYSEAGNERSKRSKHLANMLFASALKRTKAKPRSVKKSNLYVVKNTEVPAALIETGFLTHQKEAKRLLDPLYLDLLSLGIAEGIFAYLISDI